MSKIQCNIQLCLDSQEEEVVWSGTEPDAATLERVLATLARCRAATQPPVPMQIGSLEPIEIMPDAILRFGLDVEGHTMLSLRHPGFGWLSFRLSPAHREFLKQGLVRVETAQQDLYRSDASCDRPRAGMH